MIMSMIKDEEPGLYNVAKIFYEMVELIDQSIQHLLPYYQKRIFRLPVLPTKRRLLKSYRYPTVKLMQYSSTSRKNRMDS